MTRFVAVASLLAMLAVPAMPQQVQDDPLKDLEKKIDTAITKGVEWLKKQQKSDGSFTPSSGPVYGGGNQPAHPNKLGNTALAILALLKSDVEPTDPVIQKGFKFMYDYLGQRANPKSNYERAVTLMAIEALYEGMVIAKLKKEGKKPTHRAGESKEPTYTVGGNDAKFAAELVKDLVKDQTKKGGWRYGDNFTIVGSDEDISATQIMLLGLKSATRMRLVVGENTFDKAMKFILDSQEKEGPKVERESDGGGPKDRGTYASNGEDKARGWAYEKDSDDPVDKKATGAMSCAGLGGLLICKGVIGKKLNKATNTKIEQAIFDGFAWIYSHWTVSQNPGHERSTFYYLYGIERVGTMGCFERIGKHIWFTEGAKFLVDGQEKDGHWNDKEVEPSELYATCFALLFLKRGTVPIGDVITDSRFSGGTPSSPSPSPTAAPTPEPGK